MRTVLADVDATDVREVIVINKADLADPEVIDRLRRHEKHSIVVSARTGEGLDELRALIADELPQPDIDVEVLVPYDRGDLVSRIHETGEVLASEHVAERHPDDRAGARPSSPATCAAYARLTTGRTACAATALGVQEPQVPSRPCRRRLVSSRRTG